MFTWNGHTSGVNLLTQMFEPTCTALPESTAQKLSFEFTHVHIINFDLMFFIHRLKC